MHENHVLLAQNHVSKGGMLFITEKKMKEEKVKFRLGNCTKISVSFTKSHEKNPHTFIFQLSYYPEK